MALDPSIILGVKQPEFASPLDMAVKAMTLKDLGQQSNLRGLQYQKAQQEVQDDQALRQAYQKNIAPDPSGAPTLNKQGFLGDLTKVNPEKAMAMRKEIDAEDLDKLTKTTAIGKQLVSQVPTGADVAPETKQQAWTQMKLMGQKYGLPNNQNLPDQYPGDGFVNNMKLHLLTAEEQLAQQNKDREFQFKKEENGLKRQEVGLKRDELKGDRIDKLSKAMGKDLDPDAGRTGNFGRVSAKVIQAETLQTLVNSFQDHNLPPAQMEELALGMANMLSNGTGGGSRDQVKALVPSSIQGDAQKVKSWLLNEPYGANQQKFVEQMSHTIEREHKLALDQLNAIRAPRLSNHNELKRLAPEEYAQKLKSFQIDPSRIKDGVYQRTQPFDANAGAMGAGAVNFEHMSDADVDQMYSKLKGQ